VLYYTQRIPEVDALLRIAANPSKWQRGHTAFRAVRAQTLRKPGSDRECVLLLAELVAKVTYNASDPAPDDPFDEDSGWWIPALLRDLMKHIQDPDFDAKAWDLLSSGSWFQGPLRNEN